MTQLYYTAPEDKIFNEVREKAMALWPEIDTDHDKYGYATEKINRIKGITNVRDNFMYIVAMFDIDNQSRLAENLSPEARLAVRERMIEGGQPMEYIVF
jgi:hypothetical protein